MKKSRTLLWASIGLLGSGGARAFVGLHSSPTTALRPNTMILFQDDSLWSSSLHHQSSASSALSVATLSSAALLTEPDTTDSGATTCRRRRRLALWAEETATISSRAEQRLFQQLYQTVMGHSSSKKGINNDNDKNGNDSPLLLQLQHSRDGSYRGIYVNRAVSKDEIVLSVPLAACLRDDQPPAWFAAAQQSNGNRVSDDWATRLAACLLEDQFNPTQGDDQSSHHHYQLRSLWRSLLPNPDLLRASLPVNWSEDNVKSAACTALELAVDSAYFVRAQAVQDLMDAATAGNTANDKAKTRQQFGWPSGSIEQQQRQWCEQALDVIQTRTCRVEIATNGEAVDAYVDATTKMPVRLLAPVFDFINHHHRAANSAFFVQDDSLVVQAVRDLAAGDEVLVDYGASTRPAWKCLSSYGFVPDVLSSSLDEQEEEDNFNTAEVYIGGQRFEVSSTSIPETMIEAVADDNDADEEIAFTPEIALRLEQRISEAAYNMLLDPWKGTSIDVNDNTLMFEEDNVDEEHSIDSAEDILSAQLAAQLRFHQHRILLACAQGLGEWANNYQ